MTVHLLQEPYGTVKNTREMFVSGRLFSVVSPPTVAVGPDLFCSELYSTFAMVLLVSHGNFFTLSFTVYRQSVGDHRLGRQRTVSSSNDG